MLDLSLIGSNFVAISLDYKTGKLAAELTKFNRTWRADVMEPSFQVVDGKTLTGKENLNPQGF